MKLRRSLPLAVLIAALGAACGRRDVGGSGDDPEPPPTRPTATAAPTPAAAASDKGRPAGTVPFDYPIVQTLAKKDEFVLAPTKGWIEEAFEKGADTQPFIFYGAWMIDPGAKESTLRTLPGQFVQIPNAMIIVVPAGAKAKPGDIVLTAWTSGSGMQRAIVVEGGSPEQPNVRYLDMDLDNPSGWGKKVDTLKENTFHVLTKPGEPGTTVACKEGARTTRWVIVNQHRDKLLGVGFAGKVKVHARPSCTNLPIVPALKPGDDVRVAVIGAFTDATVTKLDAKIGRVWVKHEFGGKDTDEAFSFTNVWPKS